LFQSGVKVDEVCLIVESEGGLANAGIPEHVMELVKTLAHVKFVVVTIAHRPYAVTSLVTRLPENISQLITLSLDEGYYFNLACPQRKKAREFWQKLFALYETKLDDKIRYFEPVIRALALANSRVLNYFDIIQAPEFFNLIKAQYLRYCLTISFLDYVWIFRQTQLPYFQLTQFQLPKANVYHVFASRYACMLGLIEKIRNRSHLVVDLKHDYFLNALSESHQETELMEWVKSHEIPQASLEIFIKTYNASLKTNRFLAGFYADTIIVNNSLEAKSFFAEQFTYKTCSILTSGHHQPLVNFKKGSSSQLTIGFVSEINPLSDGKTCLRAARLLRNRLRDLRFLFFATGSLNPLTTEEYHNLRHQLDLELELSFLYDRDEDKFLKEIDLVVISGRLPVTQKDLIYKALAYGLPMVLVGCETYRPIIEGNSAPDRELGECGLFLEPGSPQHLASALMTLINDQTLYREMSKIALRRFELFYSKTTQLHSYVSLYNNLV